MTTCPSCGSELRPPVYAECPVCEAPLPDAVRQAVAARAEADTRALAFEQAAAAAAAAQAAQQAAAAQAAQQAAQQTAQAASGGPSPYPTPTSGSFAAPTFASSPWAAATPSVQPRASPPPSAPLSTYGAPQYAPQAGTTPIYPRPAAPVGYQVSGMKAQTSGLATTSLVLGIMAILGLCSLYGGLLLGLPGVICSHIALTRINNSGGRLGGRGIAIAGMAMSYLALGVSVIEILMLASSMR